MAPFLVLLAGGSLLFEIGNRVYPVFVPSVAELVRYILALDHVLVLLRAALWTAMAASVGVLIAIAWAVPAGLSRGLRPALRRATTTGVDFARSIPPSAMIPVCILLIGTSRTMFIALTALAVGLLVMVSTTEAIERTPPIRLALMRTANWGAPRRILRLYIPSVLPSLVASSQVVVSLAMALVIVCEMLVGSEGLGVIVREAQYASRGAELYSALLLAGAVGASLNGVLRLSFRTIETRWYQPLRFPDE